MTATSSFKVTRAFRRTQDICLNNLNLSPCLAVSRNDFKKYICYRVHRVFTVLKGNGDLSDHITLHIESYDLCNTEVNILYCNHCIMSILDNTFSNIDAVFFCFLWHNSICLSICLFFSTLVFFDWNVFCSIP